MQILVANTKGGCGKSTLVASLADVLNADIIDHDHQGTIRVASAFTGRHVPVSPHQVTKSVVIHDTPPYNAGSMISLLKEVDRIIIPTKLKYPDLLALKALADQLIKQKVAKKAIIVFNEVRRPYTKTYHELKDLYLTNYDSFAFASTELSNLVSFSRVLSEPLKGKALNQTKDLINELNIY